MEAIILLPIFIVMKGPWSSPIGCSSDVSWHLVQVFLTIEFWIEIQWDLFMAHTIDMLHKDVFNAAKFIFFMGHFDS